MTGIIHKDGSDQDDLFRKIAIEMAGDKAPMPHYNAAQGAGYGPKWPTCDECEPICDECAVEAGPQRPEHSARQQLDKALNALEVRCKQYEAEKLAALATVDSLRRSICALSEQVAAASLRAAQARSYAFACQQSKQSMDAMRLSEILG